MNTIVVDHVAMNRLVDIPSMLLAVGLDE